MNSLCRVHLKRFKLCPLFKLDSEIIFKVLFEGILNPVQVTIQVTEFAIIKCKNNILYFQSKLNRNERTNCCCSYTGHTVWP